MTVDLSASSCWTNIAQRKRDASRSSADGRAEGGGPRCASRRSSQLRVDPRERQCGDVAFADVVPQGAEGVAPHAFGGSRLVAALSRRSNRISRAGSTRPFPLPRPSNRAFMRCGLPRTKAGVNSQPCARASSGVSRHRFRSGIQRAHDCVGRSQQAWRFLAQTPRRLGALLLEQTVTIVRRTPWLKRSLLTPRWARYPACASVPSEAGVLRGSATAAASGAGVRVLGAVSNAIDCDAMPASTKRVYLQISRARAAHSTP